MYGISASTSDIGSTIETQCYLPAGEIGTDELGNFLYVQDCYY